MWSSVAVTVGWEGVVVQSVAEPFPRTLLLTVGSLHVPANFNLLAPEFYI